MKKRQKKNGQRIWTFSSEKTSMAPTKKGKDGQSPYMSSEIQTK